jgi:APA family basic amino acid/polyamine antiporter
MSNDGKSQSMKKTLSLFGATMNAMALIAPGAFLWITFQVQAAQTDTSGTTTAPDMWFGLLFALILAFLTAGSYAMLAKRYPEAGAGSSYAFAEKILREKKYSDTSIRFTKFSIGWLAHLYYWVYPGVMVAFMAILITFILQSFGFSVSPLMEIGIAIAFAIVVGLIAYRGIDGTTKTNIFLNVIQWVMLVGITILALFYRIQNPQNVTFSMSSFSDIILPHDFTHVLFQATIAILLLVGFESSTALMAETKNPSTVSRAVILSLIIQGGIAYLFEYFGAMAWINNSYTVTVNGQNYTGFAAAAQSSAPIGDMLNNLGNVLLGGNGFVLMMIVAGIVAAAILGTTLACLNTGVRVTYAISNDSELPLPLGQLHKRFDSPHVGIIALTAVSAIIGVIGVISLENLTIITLLSNIGTFLLYGLTNIIAFVSFAKEPHSTIRKSIAFLGAAANIAMLLAVVWLSIVGGGVTQAAASLATIITMVFILIGITYFVINSKTPASKLLPFNGKKVVYIPHILLLDFDSSECHYLSSEIQRNFPNLTVIRCETLQEAKMAMRNYYIDLAIIDENLYDGYGNDLLANLPAACITIGMSLQYLPVEIRHKFREFLIKPFKMEELVAIMKDRHF